MSTQENKAVIRRLVEGFWNLGNVDVLDEVFAVNFVNHNPAPRSTPEREGVKQSNLMIRAAFSDSQTTIDDVVTEGDKLAWRWTFRGRNTGSFAGMPATGKPIAMTGITLDRIVSGQIVERWGEFDALGMMQQLGVVPAPGQ